MTYSLFPFIVADLSDGWIAVISVIIVNYKVPELLSKCIAGIIAGDPEVRREIIVVDNDSQDNSRELITERYPEVTWIQMAKNSGFASAVNCGIHQAKGEFILLVNPDSTISNSTLKSLKLFLSNHPEAGVVGGKILNEDGTFQRQCRRRIPTPGAAFFRLFGFSKRFPGHPLSSSYELDDTDIDSTMQVEVVSGALMGFSRKTAVKIGLFDEGYFLFGEDIDFCHRMLLAGHINYYLPAMSAIHLRGASRQKAPFRTIYHIHFAMWRFYKKFQLHKHPIWITVGIFIGIWTRYLLLLIRQTVVNQSIRKVN